MIDWYPTKDDEIMKNIYQDCIDAVDKIINCPLTKAGENQKIEYSSMTAYDFMIATAKDIKKEIEKIAKIDNQDKEKELERIIKLYDKKFDENKELKMQIIEMSKHLNQVRFGATQMNYIVQKVLGEIE